MDHERYHHFKGKNQFFCSNIKNTTNFNFKPFFKNYTLTYENLIIAAKAYVVKKALSLQKNISKTTLEIIYIKVSIEDKKFNLNLGTNEFVMAKEFLRSSMPSHQ